MESVTKPSAGYPYLPRPTRVAKTLVTSLGVWGTVALCATRRFRWIPASTLLFVAEKHRRFLFEFSIPYLYYQHGDGEWMSELGSKLVVGGLPIKEMGHLEKLQKMGIETVVSMVEPWEQEPGWWVTPLTAEDYKEAGIQFISLPTADLFPVGQENLSTASKVQGKVYFHCRAGHGRGPSAAAAALISRNNWNAAQAIRCLKSNRPGLSIQSRQRKAIERFSEKSQQSSAS